MGMSVWMYVRDLIEFHVKFPQPHELYILLMASYLGSK